MNILSGCNKLRFRSITNHRAYSDKHGYNYKYDGKKRTLNSKYDHKIYAILDLPIDNKWWFWIDDDAFFTNFEQGFDDLNLSFDNKLMIFAKSPINLNEKWTYLSSGNFFFKNTQEIKMFFYKVLIRDINEVKKWWDEEKFGIFTNGDQDRIIYELMIDNELQTKTEIVPFEKFNTRPYHFVKSSDHFLVHFAGAGDKHLAIKEFKNKFNFQSDALVPDQYIELENHK